MSDIIQPLRSFVLHIRSKDSEFSPSDLNSHLLVDLKERISIDRKTEEIHMIVESAEIPYSFYNVSSNVGNDTILFNTSTTYTIPAQNYTATELARVLTADDSFPCSVTYNKFTMKFTFTNQAVGTTTLNWSGSTANKLMGFGFGDEIPDTTLDSSGSTAVSTNVIDLASVHSLFIKSNTSGSNVFSTRKGFSQIIQKISVDMNSGYIIYLNQNDHRQSTILYNNVDFLDLRITDQNDNLVNMNGVNYEIGITFYIYPLQSKKIEQPIDTRRIVPVNQNRVLTQPTNNNQMRTDTSNIIRPIQEDLNNVNQELSIEHEGKKLIFDKLIEQMRS